MPASLSRWLRVIAAGVLVLTIGLGQASADALIGAHEGGQSEDKDRPAATFDHAGGDAAKAAALGQSDPKVGTTISEPRFGFPAAKPKTKTQGDVSVDVDVSRLGPDDWTRTVTRTVTNNRFVSSTTRSTNIAFDDGNRVVSVAMARARAPNNAAAVEAGAGKVFAKTSVDVIGDGTGSAFAGGSIGISHGNVKVSTWGETSAEVF